jgi:hypothetical protein
MSKLRDVWVRAALALSFALPFYFAGAALSVKFGLIDWLLGFQRLTLDWGQKAILVVLGFALIGLVMSIMVPPRRGIGFSLLALLIPAAALGYGYYAEEQRSSAPPLHDISTDTMDPPDFSADVIAAREAIPAHNSLDLLRKKTADGRASIAVQQRAYPDIVSIPTGLAPAAAFDLALEEAREQSWTLGRVDRNAGVIEASEQTFWFGFTDDIAILISPDGTGARVDMRSVSRVRDADAGANAARMRPYLHDLRVRLQQAES